MLHTSIGKIFFATIIFFTVVFNISKAQQVTDTLEQISPYAIEEDFDISADLSHPAWQQAESAYIKHQIQPNDDVRAFVETEVKMLYSKKNIYVGFISSDPSPEDIRANISDRDNSFGDDFVGVFLDPFNNNQQAYELFVNPLGIQMDGMRTGNSEDMNFDMLWYSDGKITDKGYQVTLKIPFKSLNFPDRDIHKWSIQFIRNYPRNSRYMFTWTNVRLDNSCMLCQNGRLVGLKDIENTNTVELLPYGMSYQSSTINNAGNPNSGLDHGRINGRIGGSVMYEPTSTTSLNAVINPDFSQVETDQAQISANETFALYYSEKRPFFMKGSDLFNTRENLFYSRMINRPLAAGKVTHQAEDFSIAFLTAYDREAPFIIPGRYGSSLVQSDVEAYNNVVRGTYNFGSESYIGGLVTTRNQQDGHNYVGSIDWNILLTDNYYFSGQAAYANTKELDEPELFDEPRILGQSSYDAAFNGEQFGGTLLTTRFSRQAKYYDFSFGYTSYSPTFQTQNGFINQVDQRKFDASQSLSYYPEWEWLSRGNISINTGWRYDFGGQFQERYIFTRWSNNFGGQTNLSLSFLPLNDERFRGRLFTQMNRLMIDVSTNPLNELSLSGHVDFGKYINRQENPTLGEGYNFSVDATVKPTSRLEMSLSYNYSKLSAANGEEKYFSGDIYRLKGNYNFSKKFFARLITQYNSFNEQLQIYPLVYYKANPFTKFYIGMTDYLNHFDQAGPNRYTGFKETDRQFFVKFQYLIRS
ncbi:carbohydrate binding family 9 domain-containing protein [Fodinibius sp.]|uniref:carbohydrate binding family 9 domain-containing protein n=1 Tax=Fodinibius sp. TaxID=1872440 RepID=UPI002ACE1EAB|nr:sugar-binding protein [Fodinibius sp.]MDZ7658956.1 sugar-binding protein [Fodinibius sp.]